MSDKKANMADAKPPKEPTALQQALDFKQKYEALMNKAKEEALFAIDGYLAELEGLGFKYKIVPADEPAAPTTKTGITRQRDPNAPCDVCGFVTRPPHDGRKHRSQGDKKKPFTDAELSLLGLKKA